LSNKKYKIVTNKLRVQYRSVGMQVKGPMDYSNFDSYPKDVDIPPDELSGWDKDF